MKMDSNAHSYRLQKINEIRGFIERERELRATLSHRYHRSVKIISVVNNTLLVLTMGLSISGIGVLSTIIAAPVAMALEGIAVRVGLVSIIGSQVGKKLSLKAEKHEKIKTLADAKLNTISYHISKALQDDRISDEKYSLILSELDKFNIMKEEIRSKIKSEGRSVEISPDGADAHLADAQLADAQLADAQLADAKREVRNALSRVSSKCNGQRRACKRNVDELRLHLTSYNLC